MISNKLLGKVLSIDCKSNKVVGNMVIYNDHYKINVYELMHLCKKWIISQEYDVFSGGMADTQYSCYIDDQSTFIETVNVHYGDTEYEAVIKATQWIYDENNV